MPQLDKLTYLSQITWFLIIFIGFYLVSFLYILPTINQIIKTRKSKLDYYNTGTEGSNLEDSVLNLKYQNILVKIYLKGCSILNTAIKKSTQWSNSKILDINNKKSDIGTLNNKYLKKIIKVKKYTWMLK